MILSLLGREMILRSTLAISLMYFLPFLMYSCVLSRCENIKLQNSDKSYSRHQDSGVLNEFKKNVISRGKKVQLSSRVFLNSGIWGNVLVFWRLLSLPFKIWVEKHYIGFSFVFISVKVYCQTLFNSHCDISHRKLSSCHQEHSFRVCFVRHCVEIGIRHSSCSSIIYDCRGVTGHLFLEV